VSGFVKKQLPLVLVSHMSSGSTRSSDARITGLHQALRASFLDVDDNLAASSVDCEFSGCTCAVAHLQVRAG
jgi:hypothetical protein